MKNCSNFVVALVLALSANIFLSGCGLSGPSQRSVESQVRELISDGTEELFDVDRVTKTNGYKADDGTYVAEVTIEITFKVGMEDLQRDLEAESHLDDDSPAGIGDFMQIMEATGVVTWLRMQYGEFEAGDSFTESREYTFIRTERGWLVQTD